MTVGDRTKIMIESVLEEEWKEKVYERKEGTESNNIPGLVFFKMMNQCASCAFDWHLQE